MIRSIRELAHYGGRPAFGEPLNVAQLNVPDWEQAEAGFRDIFARRYFANNGPLVQQLEMELAEFLDVSHTVCVTNGTVALMAMLAALDRPAGEVIVPTFTFPASVQAISWAGLTPVFCDVDSTTHMLNPTLVEPQITDRTVAIMGVHLWGKACDPTGLEALAGRHGITLLFDACHGLGCTFGGRSLANYGLASAFSLHATKIVNAAEGGFVATNDPEIAARIRDIRNFYSAESEVMALRLNGKMSEAQALMALLSLGEYQANRELNLARYNLFRDLLRDVKGVYLVDVDERSNYQYVVVEIDESEFGLDRDTLRTLLNAENIYCRWHFHPGVHHKNPYLSKSIQAGLQFPNSDRLSQRVLQLPNGSAVKLDDVRQIVELIGAIGRLSGAIKQRGLDA